MDLGEKEKPAMENRSEENPLSFHGYMADSFRSRLWDPPASSQSLPSFSEASRGSPIAWNSSGFLPPARPPFPDDPGFIERAARFSSFSGFFPNSFRASDPMGMYKSEGNGGETSQSGGAASLENPAGEPELSGGAPPPPSSEKAVNGPAKKRKRGSLDPETDQMRAEAQLSGETSVDNADGKQRSEAKNSSSPASKHAGKNAMDAGGEAPKEDYIHVRARRGQATNSHSLAERLRREKISERMKFLQDLVPGCSKVTGKAVMLDEIINYVQSLQRQVEFLSMKLATVNPRLDFNIESLLSKEMLQSRGISASSFEFSPEMGHHPQMHPQQGLILSGIPGLANPSDVHRRSMSAQLASNQMSGVWDEELHHVLQMGFGGSAPLGVQDLHGFSPLGQMKSEQ